MLLSQAGNIFNKYHNEFLTKSEVLVLNQLAYYLQNYAKHSSSGSDYYFCSNKKLADDLNVSCRTIIRSTAKLKELGFIDVKKFLKKKRNNSNFYSINYSKLSEILIEKTDIDKVQLSGFSG